MIKNVDTAAKPLVLAYFLPQFHEIPENNLWWGQGFTEWTNLRVSKEFISGQSIRKPSGPFNEYNLLEAEVLIWHQQIAEAYGIDGFFVWDYWFGEGKKLLEKPIEKVLRENIHFRYCFNWANHSWYNKSKGLLLIEQKYLGEEDYKSYFRWLLPHFKSENYIKIDGKPIFGIFRPDDIPDFSTFLRVFNQMAQENGFPGIFWIGENTSPTSPEAVNLDRVINSGGFFSLRRRIRSSPFETVRYHLIKNYGMNKLGPSIFKYPSLVLGNSRNMFSNPRSIPCVLAGWDTTPRHGKRGMILKGFSRDAFRAHVKEVFSALDYQTTEHKIIVIKSWNEWAEGNLLEPDSVFGTGLLEIFRDALKDYVAKEMR
ncbi:glycoside hydrolase family 99-like domain-containing protein [Deinococcus sp. VB343]|uniref:glycosyltransferase WbsX family protein n=1 Tax=Deinococcus sp. VB343 TaxID=3385567 RepID=UPI0039C9261C